MSVTLCLLAHSETNRFTMSYWFYLGYPQSTKTEMLSMLVLDTFWKLQKLIPSKKNQSLLIVKISSHKTQKIQPIRKNILLQKFRPTRGALYSREKVISFSLAIEHFHNAHITLCFPPSPKKKYRGNSVPLWKPFDACKTARWNWKQRMRKIFPEGR